MRCTNSVARLVVVTSVMVSSAAVWASDYSNECKSADGRYVTSDDVLYRASDTEQSKGIPYVILERQVLEEKNGYCLSNHRDAKGQKYNHYFMKSRLLIEVSDAGKIETATLHCELAASGLPAAFSCDRDVTTVDRKEPGPVESYRAGAPGAWDHNGSLMRLEADGATRRMYYMNPRDGMRAVGVTGNTLLFDVEVKGRSLEGTARYFSAKCGAREFPVKGTISEDQARIELSGVARRVDANCKPAGTRQERLIFTRNP